MVLLEKQKIERSVYLVNKRVETAADGKLTRQQLKELEAKEMTPVQRFFELVIMILPLVCGIISVLEYKLIPDNSMNRNPNTYFWFLVILVGAYVVYGAYAGIINELIAVVKETSVVGYVSVIDLQVALKQQGSDIQPIIGYIMLALVYIVLVVFFTIIIRLIERRLRAGDKR